MADSLVNVKKVIIKHSTTPSVCSYTIYNKAFSFNWLLSLLQHNRQGLLLVQRLLC